MDMTSHFLNPLRRFSHGNSWVGLAGFSKGGQVSNLTFSELSSVFSLYIVVQLQIAFSADDTCKGNLS